MFKAIKRLFGRNKAYISEIDRFLMAWNDNHLKSKSQLEEIQKYKIIYKLRDKSNNVSQ